MQLSNIIVRLNGSMTNTVPKQDVTPAEILILRHLHGDDAVVDVRPTKFDNKIRGDREVGRLRRKYDRGSSFVSKPGDETKSVIDTLFPGAMKKLPATLEEIGIDSGQVVPEPVSVPDLPLVDTDEPEVDEAEAGEPETEDDAAVIGDEGGSAQAG